MKPVIVIIGVILLLFGVGTFSYRYFTYSSKENVLEIGNLQVTAKTEKAVVIPPAVSGVAIAAGIILIILGAKRRT